MELIKMCTLLSLTLSLASCSSQVQLQESIQSKPLSELRAQQDDYMTESDDDFRRTFKMDSNDDDYKKAFKMDDDYHRTFKMDSDDDDLRMEGDDDDFRRMEGDDDDFRRMEGDDDDFRKALAMQDDFIVEQDPDYLEQDDYQRREGDDDDFVIERGEQGDNYVSEREVQDYQTKAAKASSMLRELAHLQEEAHSKPPHQQVQQETDDRRKKALFEDVTDMDALVQRIMSEQAPDDEQDSDDDDTAMNQLVMVSAEGYEYHATEQENNEVLQAMDDYLKHSETSDSAYSAGDGASHIEDYINATSQRIFGRDTRIRLRYPYPYYYPFSAMGRVDSGCTGTFIGPQHVLTAGHCVYNPYSRRWNRNLNVRRCKACSSRTGYTYRWKYAVTVRGWIHGRRTYDYGVIVVNRPSPSWMAFGWRKPMPRYTIRLAGYPADKGGQCMYFSYCQLKAAYSKMLGYYCDTYQGMSGAGVYTFVRDSRKRSLRVVYGVHVGASYRRNVAVRITKRRFRTLLYIRRRFR